MARMVILDGNSLVNRAFYALPPLTSAEGLPTNAVHGFMTMLLKLQKEQKPDYWVVAFDKTKPTIRLKQYEDYKSQRKETPETLKPQFTYLKEILNEFSIPVLELEGYEADDLIASVTKKAVEAGMEVFIFTGDRDALQLVSPSTKVFLTIKGISEVECYDEKKVFEKYQLKPEQIVDLKGLMGDASDNIPGVPGVGEKTALKLLWQFGTVENVLAHVDEVSGNKIKNNLKEYAEQALLSKKLATMIQDVPLEFSIEDLAWREPEKGRAVKVLQRYSLYTVLRLFEQNFGSEQSSQEISKKAEAELTFSKRIATSEQNDEEICLDDQSWLELISNWLKNKASLVLSYRYEGNNPRQGKWTELGISDGNTNYTMIRDKVSSEVKKKWYELLEDSNVLKIVADSKSLYHLLANEGKVLSGISLDLSLAAYLINSNRANYSSAELLREYTDGLFSLPVAKEAELLGNLAQEYNANISALGLEFLLHEIEEPLSIVLADMEREGIAVDKEMLEEFGRELEKEIRCLEMEIYELATTKFNINSPQQLGKILFVDLGLPPVKKTKTGYSTDADTLEELRNHHAIVGKILQYRQLVKLSTTYVKGLLSQIQDGKIHTTFQQTVTATGRLSSTEPNLQNIPIRLEEGRKLRKVFRPTKEGWTLLSADYSQIELRILAHYSEDPLLCESFIVGEDIHARTASEIFEVTLDEVTSDMRRKAKAVNFGLMYGLSDFGLARDLGIPRKEAKYYIKQYFERYCGVKRYMHEVIKSAKETGEVRTLLNRIRRIPELSHPNRMRRQFGERIAMNTPIQGTAADIMKIAMIKVAAALKKYNADILLQVHDELLIQVTPDELDKVAVIVKEAMENAYKLSVPLVVDCKIGENWYDMKPYLCDE